MSSLVNVLMIVSALIFSSNLFATGSIGCKSKEVEIEWEVGHMAGYPMVTNKLYLTTAKKTEEIKDINVVNYYANDGMFFILALDKDFMNVAVDLKYMPKQNRTTLILYQGKTKKVYDIDCTVY